MNNGARRQLDVQDAMTHSRGGEIGHALVRQIFKIKRTGIESLPAVHPSWRSEKDGGNSVWTGEGGMRIASTAQ